MMLLNSEILFKYGALQKTFEPGEFIFHEGDSAKYYYQIHHGKVKMFTTNDDGKLFTQGVFVDGESFGEPPLLIQERYPASAQAINRSTIYKMASSSFFQLLDDHPDLKHNLMLLMAARCYNKSITSRDLMNQKTDHRILSFLKEFKRKRGNPSVRILIPFTRQEIADFTGLRVETVIRTLRSMCDLGLVEIRERKLFY